jgi:dienelactone hydrolase
MPICFRARELKSLLAAALFFAPLQCVFSQDMGQDTYVRDAQHFDYDRNAALDVKQISAEKRGDTTVYDITYASAGGQVPAYLVVPKGDGPFAAILWGHWLMPHSDTANRKEFLDEAVVLAQAGVVSLLIDAPQKRPGFQLESKPLGSQGSELIGQQVIDLRRGIDLLASRKDVDAKRIGYVGHSWDARAGSILDAVDKRLAAFVFMGAPISARDFTLTSDAPNMVAARKAIPAATLQAYLDANAWADAGTYAAHLGPAPALFEYALHDDFSPVAYAKQYFAASSGPKEVKFYDSGHALNEEARRDRFRFLREHLALSNLLPGVLESIPQTN